MPLKRKSILKSQPLCTHGGWEGGKWVHMMMMMMKFTIKCYCQNKTTTNGLPPLKGGPFVQTSHKELERWMHSALNF